MNQDLEKSKIINMNDFIFKTKLEFHPNLEGLSCEKNILIYKKDGHVITGEALTFDLRTLPAKVWNMEPEEFIDVIKLNNECLTLTNTSEYINKHIYDTFMNPEKNIDFKLELVRNQTTKYYEGANNTDLLGDNAAYAVGDYGNNIIKSYEEGRFPEGVISEAIKDGIDDYLARFPEEKNKVNALDNTRDNTKELMLVRTLKQEEPTSKAGFINIVVILYGILNIGLIVAAAIMK